MSQVIKCPKCQGAMRLPPGTKGGTFLCPSCQAPLTVNIGPALPSKTTSSQSTWESLPPPAMPSAHATQQGGHVWREASEQFLDAEQQRQREEARTSANTRPAKANGYRPPKRRGNSSNGLSGCFVLASIVGALGVLAALGLVVALIIFGGSTELVLDGYKATANGSRRMEKNDGDRRTVAVENPFTKSGFLIVTRDFPPGTIVDLDGYLNNLRKFGKITEVASIRKLELEGIRYRFKSNLASSPPHIGEIYQTGNKALILMYIPGDEFLAIQGRKSRYSPQQQNQKDAPDDFFASFEKAN
ncbi:hypothetical protein SH449x_005318 [Pirellulaceae bacterium SH449]